MLPVPYLWLPPEKPAIIRPMDALQRAMLALVGGTLLAGQPAVGGAGPTPTVRASFPSDVYNSGSTGTMMGAGIGLPSGHTTNDILVYVFSGWRGGDLPHISAPSGYTQIFSLLSQAGMAAWWKRDGGSESAQTIGITDSFTLGAAFVFAVTGCVTSGTPYEGLQTAQDLSVAPNVTTTNSNRLLMDFHGGGSASPAQIGTGDAASSGWTKQKEVANATDSASSCGVLMQTKSAPSSGSQTMPSLTLSGASGGSQTAALAWLPNPSS